MMPVPLGEWGAYISTLPALVGDLCGNDERTLVKNLRRQLGPRPPRAASGGGTGRSGDTGLHKFTLSA
jgi:hypothetical protein